MLRGRPAEYDQIAWITVEQAEKLHDAVIEHYGGLKGYPHPGLLSSAVHAPQQILHYDESGRCDLYDLAAAYLYHIAKAHAFTDGNKRTAALTALYFLFIHGIDVTQPGNRLVLARVTERAAQDKLSKPQLAEVIRKMRLPKYTSRPVVSRDTGEHGIVRQRRKGKRKSKKRLL